MFNLLVLELLIVLGIFILLEEKMDCFVDIFVKMNVFSVCLLINFIGLNVKKFKFMC